MAQRGASVAVSRERSREQGGMPSRRAGWKAPGLWLLVEQAKEALRGGKGKSGFPPCCNYLRLTVTK